MRALYRASIWHPDAIPMSEGQTAIEQKRYVLPVFDICIVVMGFNAVLFGMPSFNLVLSPFIASAAAWTFLMSGLTAMIGVSFPRLWIAEAVGKLAMVAVIGGYATALWVLGATEGGQRLFVAAGLTALLIPPMWNLWRLGRERLVRKNTATSGVR